MTIELRSDTFTKPSKAMLEAMMAAPVGDDVFLEDPTVNALEAKVAEMFNMEAALFCPSGTMTNQIAIKCHTQPGDEVICDELSHVYQYEGGGIAFNSGCSIKVLQGNRGRINAQQVLAAINPNDVHKAKTSLVCIENTTNRGGGACYNFDDLVAIKNVCKEHQIGFHLDGARLFNALVSTGQTTLQFGELFDSISICLSKGLGAPVGSLVIGTKDFINKSRRYRKVFGGGMRQAGYIAAAGIYALDNNITILKLDHEHAKMVANVLTTKDFIFDILPVETNILIFSVGGKYSATELAKEFGNYSINCIAISPTQIRMVFHLNVNDEQVEKICQVLTHL